MTEFKTVKVASRASPTPKSNQALPIPSSSFANRVSRKLLVWMASFKEAVPSIPESNDSGRSMMSLRRSSVPSPWIEAIFVNNSTARCSSGNVENSDNASRASIIVLKASLLNPGLLSISVSEVIKALKNEEDARPINPEEASALP